MAWNLSDARLSFQAQSRAWDELNAATGGNVLLDSVLVQAQLTHLADRPVLLAGESSMSSPAMMLLVYQGRGRWCTFQPSQQPIGNAIFVDPARAYERISELMRILPGYALVLGVTQQDPECGGLPRCGDDPRLEMLDFCETGRVRLRADFDSYWCQRPADLREGNARRRRRLAREGTDCSMRVLRQPEQIKQGIQEYCRLEASGWKVGAGTAVGMNNAQGPFYNAALQGMCTRGEGAVYQLLFDDRPVASQICVERDRMSVSLKIAFDESFRRDAPGYLLQEEIIRELHGRSGFETIEFYGEATDGWTHKWTDETHRMHHVNVFRTGAVRSAVTVAKSLLRPRRASASAAA